MPGTGTLAYSASLSVTKKKSFITLTYVACTLNLLQSYFTIVATVASGSVNDASMSVIDDSRVMLKIVVSLTDNSIHVIYNCYMFIV